jgi:hypothetical protein
MQQKICHSYKKDYNQVLLVIQYLIQLKNNNNI